MFKQEAQADKGSFQAIVDSYGPEDKGVEIRVDSNKSLPEKSIAVGGSQAKARQIERGRHRMLRRVDDECRNASKDSNRVWRAVQLCG